MADLLTGRERNEEKEFPHRDSLPKDLCCWEKATENKSLKLVTFLINVIRVSSDLACVKPISQIVNDEGRPSLLASINNIAAEFMQ